MYFGLGSNEIRRRGVFVPPTPRVKRVVQTPRVKIGLKFQTFIRSCYQVQHIKLFLKKKVIEKYYFFSGKVFLIG